MGYPMRTRFGKDIVCEFFAPARITKKQKAAIICTGMPSSPGSRAMLEFFSKKGYWVFQPRYRGSWESSGSFLARSPEEDIRDVMDGLTRGFSSAKDGERFRLNPSEIILIAGSFGGPAGLLLSRDERVKKVIAVSPVVEWRAPSPAEPLDWLYEYVREAFGEGYRVKKSDWDKLKKGNFYNPLPQAATLDGKKIFIIHAKDDDSVRFKEVAKFIKLTKAKSRIYAKGGHLSLAIITKPALWKVLARFVRS
jgi:pimeloyl-ACP methyl ester carboxylesterase